MTRNKIKVEFSREEALACAIALDKEKKSYKWQHSALIKLDKALGIPPSREVER